MGIVATPHSIGRIEALGGQTGDAIEIADGDVSDAFATGAYVRIKATSGCNVRIGTGLVNATAGEPWSEGDVEVRLIAAGQVIAVDAA